LEATDGAKDANDTTSTKGVFVAQESPIPRNDSHEAEQNYVAGEGTFLESETQVRE
jgi:hypothetical protein